MKSAATMKPGRMPATNSLPIETSVSTPQKISRIDGGISIPSIALPATTPRAIGRS